MTIMMGDDGDDDDDGWLGRCACAGSCWWLAPILARTLSFPPPCFSLSVGISSFEYEHVSVFVVFVVRVRCACTAIEFRPRTSIRACVHSLTFAYGELRIV